MEALWQNGAVAAAAAADDDDEPVENDLFFQLVLSVTPIPVHVR